MKRSVFVILLVSTCVATTAFATTYVRVEKDGTKTYSDRPIPGGKPIDLQPAQSYSAPEPAIQGSGGATREQELVGGISDFRYSSCAVTPENDASFTNPEFVNISVALKPLLRPGDAIELLVDGARVGGGGTTNYSLTPANRGTHTVSVSIKDQYGKVICSSSSAFHIFRPSINMPGRR